MRWTLTPAYGRDYKSKAEVTAAFDAGKDFIEAASGRYCSRADVLASGAAEVNIRYGRLRKVAVVKVAAPAAVP